MWIFILPVEHQAVPLVIVNVANAAFRWEIRFSVGIVASILILPMIYDDAPRSVDKIEQIERFVPSTWRLRPRISHCYFVVESLTLRSTNIHNIKLKVNFLREKFYLVLFTHFLCTVLYKFVVSMDNYITSPFSAQVSITHGPF